MPAPAPAPAPARSGKKLLVLAASVLLLSGAGVVGYLELGKAPPKEAGDQSGAKPPAVEIDPGVVELEPFVLNLSDPAGDRYFRLRVSIALDRKAVAARASEGLGLARLRDRVLSVLSRKRASQVTSAEGKEGLRDEIRSAAAALLAEPPLFDAAADQAPAHVMDVFFTEFLLQ